MDERPLKIPVLLATVRRGRMSVHAARLVHAQLTEESGVETQLVDFREFDIPIDDAGEGLKNPGFSATVDEADGLVIVSPEYNHGYPGILKHVLDTNYWEYVHKAVGVVGVSSGAFGGARMIENLLPVLRAYGLVPIERDLNFSRVNTVFDEEGNLLEERYLKRTQVFLSELLWMAKTLRHGRQHIPSEVRA